MGTHKVTVTKVIEIEPFPAPNYATTADPKTPNLRISEVPVDILSRMCDEWRARVFELAGQDDPTAALSTGETK